MPAGRCTTLTTLPFTSIYYTLTTSRLLPLDYFDGPGPGRPGAAPPSPPSLFPTYPVVGPNWIIYTPGRPAGTLHPPHFYYYLLYFGRLPAPATGPTRPAARPPRRHTVYTPGRPAGTLFTRPAARPAHCTPLTFTTIYYTLTTSRLLPLDPHTPKRRDSTSHPIPALCNSDVWAYAHVRFI